MYKEVVCDDGSIYALPPVTTYTNNIFLPITVESLLTDTPNKGHCIKYLSTMDKTKSPNFNNWNLLIEDSLYIVDKPLEFILVPKCPLFGDSTVCHFTIW